MAEQGYAEVLETSEHNARAGSTPVITTCIDCGKKKAKKATRCKSCSQIEKNKNKRKRPEAIQLKQDLIDYNENYCAIGRKYQVSDNAIRKWIKFYQKHNLWN